MPNENWYTSLHLSITPQPTSSPTSALPPDTFIPGDLTVSCDNNNLLLSTVRQMIQCFSLCSIFLLTNQLTILLTISLSSKGMGCERIASEGSPVSFQDGSSSSGAAGNFHLRADGAGVIPSTDPSNPGGWYYVTTVGRRGGGMYCYLLPHKIWISMLWYHLSL